MTHSSAIRQVVHLFSLFAEEPCRLFSAAAVARALRLSAASCHTLLATFVESGFLYRTRNKTYVMGPKLSLHDLTREPAAGLGIADFFQQRRFCLAFLAGPINPYLIDVGVAGGARTNASALSSPLEHRSVPLPA